MDSPSGSRVSLETGNRPNIKHTLLTVTLLAIAILLIITSIIMNETRHLHLDQQNSEMIKRLEKILYILQKSNSSMKPQKKESKKCNLSNLH